MPVYSRQQLSSAVNGIFNASATSAANAQIIHQVQATSTSAIESVWLKLRSRQANDSVFFIVLDTATATNTAMKIHIEDRTSTANLIELFQGLPLSGTDTILRAYSATEDGNLNIEGYYNLIATG